jgi:tetratricopeptide (TPR) repeat protein
LVRQSPEIACYRDLLSTVLANLGLIVPYDNRGEKETFLRRAIDLREQLLKDCPDVPYYQTTLQHALQNLGFLLADRGDDAIPVRRRSLQLAESLAERFPSVPSYRLKLGQAYGNLGKALDSFQHDEKQRLVEQSLEIFESLVAEYPENPRYRQDLRIALYNLGEIHFETGQTTAVAPIRELLARAEALLDAHPDKQGYAGPCAGLAGLLNDLSLKLHGEMDFEPALRQAVGAASKVHALDNSSPRYRWVLMSCQNSLGHELARKGSHDEALAHARRALEFSEALVREFPDNPKYRDVVAQHYDILGERLKGQGYHEEAIDALQKEVAVLENLVTENPNNRRYREKLVKVHARIATYLIEVGRSEDATAAEQRATELRAQLDAQEQAKEVQSQAAEVRAKDRLDQ